MEGPSAAQLGTGRQRPGLVTPLGDNGKPGLQSPRTKRLGSERQAPNVDKSSPNFAEERSDDKKPGAVESHAGSPESDQAIPCSGRNKSRFMA